MDDTMTLILHAGPIVKGVLIWLLLFSIFSWAIIFYKQSFFHFAAKQSDAFLRAFRGGADPKALLGLARSLRSSPMANVYVASVEQGRQDRDDVRRTIKRFEALEISKLHSYLTFLATTGSTSPFIGLLGTVWGIIDAFRGIGTAGSASLAGVAPGIAEALITTAVGLAAAIPAVIGYNYYLSRAKRMTVELEDFSEELLDVLSRESVSVRERR